MQKVELIWQERAIISKYIKDPNPPKELLLDHVLAKDGTRPNSPLFKERVSLAVQEYIQKFGRRKMSRDQLSARLAGSALVGYNLGFAIEGIQIQIHSGLYSGFVDSRSVSRNLGPNWFLFREATATIAGFSGEQYAGLDHPTSSVDNKMAAAAICRFMSATLGKDEWHFFNRALDLCKTTLSTNPIQFEKLRSLVAASDHVVRDEALMAVNVFCPVPVEGFLYA